MFAGTVRVSWREMGLHLIDPVPALPHGQRTIRSAIISALMLSFLMCKTRLQSQNHCTVSSGINTNTSSESREKITIAIAHTGDTEGQLFEGSSAARADIWTKVSDTNIRMESEFT